MDSKSEIQDQFSGESLAKLTFDCVKENDVKFIFEVLSSPPEKRTIADLDTLAKIMMHQIEPVKRIQNMSAIYFLCQRMLLIKYKSKDIVYQDFQRADSLYIILTGKVAFYKKSTEYFDTDEVIFLNSGSCFGKFYQWKVRFIPISVEETLLAVAPKTEISKIPVHLSYEREIMVQELKNSDIFLNSNATLEEMQEASKFLILTKVPCGSFLIRQGETPKAIFYIFKGIVKKIIYSENKIIEVKRFTQGQYCPLYLKDSYNFELITETPCQIIVIPKKVLKLIRNPLVFGQMSEIPTLKIDEQLRKKKQWQEYKENYMTKLIGGEDKKIMEKNRKKEASWK